jgi:hypothetical protein
MWRRLLLVAALCVCASAGASNPLVNSAQLALAKAKALMQTAHDTAHKGQVAISQHERDAVEAWDLQKKKIFKVMVADAKINQIPISSLKPRFGRGLACMSAARPTVVGLSPRDRS